MKKVYLLLLATGLFAFVACNEGGGEAEDTSTEADAVEEVVEEAEAEEPAAEEGELLADHVCNDNCTEEACSFAHGEKGHECGDDCAGDGDHDHGEGHEDGDGHDHDGGEESDG